MSFIDWPKAKRGLTMLYILIYLELLTKISFNSHDNSYSYFKATIPNSTWRNTTLVHDHRQTTEPHPRQKALTARLTQTSQVPITSKHHLTSWNFLKTDIITKWTRTAIWKSERQTHSFIVTVVMGAVEQWDLLNYCSSHPFQLPQAEWIHLKFFSSRWANFTPMPKVWWLLLQTKISHKQHDALHQL